MTSTSDRGVAATRGLGGYAAAALVFGSSAAVLVVELTSLRLLAPYLGLTLETSTIVIGTALAAIAVGSWSGGRMADRVPPQRLIGPLLAFSGVAVALTPFAVRGAGALSTDWALLLILVSALSIIVPGSLLAAVTPMVTKLRLTSLDETGTVVGRLSGIGTAGAIAGTVVTGFVLISRVPVSGILVGLGVLLVLAAVAVEWQARGPRAAAVPAALVLVGGLTAAVAPGDCDAETTYHCAVVVPDPDRSTGRTLVLDGLRHSYVDLADDRHLEFPYIRAIVAGIDSEFPADRPLRAYHLGGGGLTVPRYLAATRPGTTSVVSEIDPGVVRVDTELLGFRPDPGVEVRVEDGRLGVRRLADDSRDLVVGDAFGGVSVPWHLTTREAVGDIDRVLTPDGVYVLNLLDSGPLDFARAEVATLQERFGQVVLLTEASTLADRRSQGGNLVVVASQRPVNAAELRDRLRDLGLDEWRVVSGAELAAWVGPAPVLTDDYAPVDQLLTPR
jgi:spermidine synthase/MFS family permease